MKKIDITSWLSKGSALEGFAVGDKFNIDQHSNFQYVGRQEDYGFYYLPNGLRIGINGEKIDEVGLQFLSMTKKAKVFLSINGKEVLLNKLTMHKFLDALNDLGLNWEPIKNHDTSRLLVQLSASKIYITFDIYEGRVETIIQSLPLH